MPSASSSTENDPRLRGVLWLAITAAIAFLLAAGFGPLVRLLPWSAEEAIAARLGDVAESSGCTRPASKAALERLVTRLYPLDARDHGFPLHVEVIRGDQVNAFASLGGHVFVFEGLLKMAKSPDELAGVLAHEIGHVARRHVLQKIALRLLFVPFTLGTSTGGIISPETLEILAHLKYGRQQEQEADLDGLDRLRLAHIDSAPLARFLDAMAESTSAPEFLSDHPDARGRAELARSRAGGTTTPALDEFGWRELQRICERGD